MELLYPVIWEFSVVPTSELLHTGAMLVAVLISIVGYLDLGFYAKICLRTRCIVRTPYFGYWYGVQGMRSNCDIHPGGCYYCFAHGVEWMELCAGLLPSTRGQGFKLHSFHCHDLTSFVASLVWLVLDSELLLTPQDRTVWCHMWNTRHLVGLTKPCRFDP